MNTRTKEFIALIDADDCLYNPVYRYLLLYCIANYHEELTKIFDKNAINDQVAELKSDHTEDLYSEIIKKIETLIDFNENNNTLSIEGLPIERIVELFPPLHKIILTNNPTDEDEDEDEATNNAAKKSEKKVTDKDINVPMTRNIIAFLNKLLENKSGEKLYKSILAAANIPLFDNILTRMKKEKCDHLTLMSISSRTCFRSDQANALSNGTNLIKKDISLLAEIFNELLDATNGDKCSHLNCRFDDIFDQNVTVFDSSKYSLYILLLHYIAFQYPDRENIVAVYDDNVEILAMNAAKFISAPILIPACIPSLELLHYEGKFAKEMKVFEFHKGSNADEHFCKSLIEQGFVCKIKGSGEPKNFTYLVTSMVNECINLKNDKFGKVYLLDEVEHRSINAAKALNNEFMLDLFNNQSLDLIKLTRLNSVKNIAMFATSEGNDSRSSSFGGPSHLPPSRSTSSSNNTPDSSESALTFRVAESSQLSSMESSMMESHSRQSSTSGSNTPKNASPTKEMNRSTPRSRSVRFFGREEATEEVEHANPVTMVTAAKEPETTCCKPCNIL